MSRSHFLFFLFFFVLVSPLKRLCSQPIGFIWTKSNSGSLNEEGRSVCTDKNGNIIVAGIFSSPTITIETTTLTNADTIGGSLDFFLSKHDANGNLIWAKSASGNRHDSAEGVATDSAGNIYVVGSFSSTSLVLDSFVLNNASFSVDTGDVFIVKYSPSGNVVWAKRAGSSSYDWAYGVCTNSKNNILITGVFSGPSIVFENDTLVNNNSMSGDLFFVEYDTAGNLVRSMRTGGPYTEVGASIAVDRSDNVLITGSLWGSPFIFGADTLLTTSPDTADVLIIKYDPLGNELWARSVGGNKRDYGRGICSDSNGNILVCGSFDSPSISFGSSTLINSMFANCFVSKYDSLGNVLWANTTQNNIVSYMSDVASDSSNNVFVSGFCAGTNIFLGFDTIHPVGNHDAIVVKYDPLGNQTWMRSAGGPANDFAHSIVLDDDGNPIITGSYAGSPVNFGTATYSGTGGNDFFVARTGNTTGINNLFFDKKLIQFYPNPFSSNAILEIKDFKVDNSVLYLFDITGREVLKKEIKNQYTEIQKGDLNPGMYFFKLVSENRLIGSGKIIIQ